MVLGWPWRAGPSSPADFERTLSTLSAKISTTQTRLDTARTRSRRYKVLLTLYSISAYVAYAAVVFLVVGVPSMRAFEWSVISSAPLLIYSLRRLVAGYYGYVTDALEGKLRGLKKERAETISQLKESTKYDTTQQLLEKYGGERKPEQKSEPEPEAKPKPQPRTPPRRTGLPPPPTANIPRPVIMAPAPSRQQSRTPDHMAEFAPNAEAPGHDIPAPPTPAPAHYQAAPSGPHWYDRVIDVLLGEDEKDARNRIVLICSKCRLVNGQAPPGTKSLSELGRWKCISCKAMNGEEDEGEKLVREALRAKKETTPSPPEGRRRTSEREPAAESGESSH